MRTVEQLLEESPALASLPPEHRATMAGCARLHVFYPGEPAAAARATRPTSSSSSGAAPSRSRPRCPGAGPVTLETLGPGEILGWSWLVPPYRSAFGARALDAVHVIALDGACLRGKCERDPALGFDLLKVVATVFVRRLEETRMRLLDLYAGVPHAG